jgi:hypothetical protein
MQRGKWLHARADHIGNEVEPRRRKLVGPEVKLHRFGHGVPLLGHTLTCEALILWGTNVAGVAT